MSKLLPSVNILIAVGAAIVYFCVGDVRRGIYWTSAAVLTASVTF
jgi:hypothetical protein